jgi:cytoskeletal protein CcmA (bactofilin family)
MFKKREPSTEDPGLDDVRLPAVKELIGRASNTILKGNKLMGDINVTCDLELSGDIEGNIISKTDSNIIIKGSCSGNIETKGGKVDIEGSMLRGNIYTGSEVRITGKFNGGEIVSKGKIYINGEFTGKLEGKEIEIGPNAKGNGKLLYRENISIARGAIIEGQICQAQQELVLLKSPLTQKNIEKEDIKKEIGNE